MRKNILFILPLAFTLCNSVQSQISFPETEGWKLTTTSSYNSETLWEYINGAADYYLNYGFDKLDVAEYQRTDDEYFKLEIYQHSSQLNAFGIYAYERPGETTFLELGAEGYIEHSSINFYGNNWYVKIHSHQKDENAIHALKDIAKKVSELMGKETAQPKELDFLPSENIIAHSEKFYPSNFLGLSFLTNALSADYSLDDKKYTIFLISEKSPKDAETALGKYFEFTKKSDTPTENKIYSINDLFNGQVFIIQNKNKLIGILELKDEEKAKEILAKISTAIN